MSAPGVRPVVALDVDGVVRVLPAHLPDERGVSKDADPAAITIRSGRGLFTPFHSMPSGTMNILLARGVGGWIRSLLERNIEVVWATTWMDHANTYIAPLLDIPELPVATIMHEDSYRYRGDSATWKLDQLVRAYRGRPLIWIDDHPPGFEWQHRSHRRLALEDARAQRRDRGVSLIIAPSPLVGITAADMQEAEDWLALVATARGRANLRAERQRRLRRDRDAWKRGETPIDSDF